MSAFVTLGKDDNSAQALLCRPRAKLSRQSCTSRVRARAPWYAMLLNEFLKEHRNVAEQQRTIAELKTTVAQQQKQIEALTATVRKVSERVKLSVPALRIAANED